MPTRFINFTPIFTIEDLNLSVLRMTMQSYSLFPDKKMTRLGIISDNFLGIGIEKFHSACRFVQELPYGYNSDRDDLLILFKEKMGSCTTKHAVIATLAEELNLPIAKHIGIYAMNEKIVTGCGQILETYALPYLPMLHCFLVFGDHSVDLTEGNDNGKNRPIDTFLWSHKVISNISSKDEYRLYREGLAEAVLVKNEFDEIEMKTVLKAREKGLVLLQTLVSKQPLPAH